MMICLIVLWRALSAIVVCLHVSLNRVRFISQTNTHKNCWCRWNTLIFHTNWVSWPFEYFLRSCGPSSDRYAANITKDFLFFAHTLITLLFPGFCLAICAHFSFSQVPPENGENHKLNIFPNKENSASRKPLFALTQRKKDGKSPVPTVWKLRIANFKILRSG